jgi:hypothetical protein
MKNTISLVRRQAHKVRASGLVHVTRYHYHLMSADLELLKLLVSKLIVENQFCIGSVD